jgi:prepilin-type N-terminal cleavage/methylation domain-containing protein
MMKHIHIKKASGFTMVELMIAMVLSLILGSAVVTIFANNSHSFNQDENVLRMQDDARHALREIAFEISMAGHYADLLLPGSIVPDSSLTLGTDCGPAGSPAWMYQTQAIGTDQNLSIVALDNANAAAASASHTCIAGGEFRDGSDVVAIKRVAGARAAAPSAGRVYLRTNGTVGLLYRQPANPVPPIIVAPPLADWEYRPSIYFIRNYANAPGDGIPALCKKVLRAPGPTMVTECLAAGIEDLQVEYGIDLDDDGQPNVFLPNPTLAQMQSVVSARIFLLARTTDIDTRYQNVKTYNVSNAPPYTPGDSFHRRVVSTTVSIQNIRSLNMMGF